MDELDIKMSEFEKELHELRRKVIKFICLEIEKECIKNKWSFRYAFCNPKITNSEDNDVEAEEDTLTILVIWSDVHFGGGFALCIFENGRWFVGSREPIKYTKPY